MTPSTSPFTYEAVCGEAKYTYAGATSFGCAALREGATSMTQGAIILPTAERVLGCMCANTTTQFSNVDQVGVGDGAPVDGRLADAEAADKTLVEAHRNDGLMGTQTVTSSHSNDPEAI